MCLHSAGCRCVGQAQRSAMRDGWVKPGVLMWAEGGGNPLPLYSVLFVLYCLKRWRWVAVLFFYAAAAVRAPGSPMLDEVLDLVYSRHNPSGMG